MGDPANAQPRRFVRHGVADVSVLVVTYNNAHEISDLIESLRPESDRLRLRVVVADNSSSDDTVAIVRAHADVVCVETGGNLGYAGGINAAAQHAGEARARLILNPDLRVRPGAVAALLRIIDADSSVGIAAPKIIDDDGHVSVSLFHEPAVFRALCDAVLGPVWKTRPRPFTEWDRSRGAHTRSHDVDWASGAALMIATSAAHVVGEWDERFFLYSEETDYCRRVRDAGFRVRFEPASVVEHSQGKSGSSAALDALLAVSRIRYVRKHSPRTSGVYRRVAILSSRIRAGRPGNHRVVLATLRDEASWPGLPHATWHGDPGSTAASVVIPAHNEAAVIARTLDALSEPIRTGALEVHVLCNGCTDDTARVAQRFAGVNVVELAEPSKIAALNAGDDIARVLPRIYLDADIELPSAAIPGLLRALSRPGVLGGRPRFEYDTLSSPWAVRAYYRARMRIPAMSEALWGAGIYALNTRGHAEVLPFPRVIADDVYVDQTIREHEKVFPLTPPARVRVPTSASALLAILSRARRGPSEQGIDGGRGTLVSLARTVRGPRSLLDAAVYTALTARARLRVRAVSAPAAWERDESTRQGDLPRNGVATLSTRAHPVAGADESDSALEQ